MTLQAVPTSRLESPIKRYSSIDDIYADKSVAFQKGRWAAIAKKYEELFQDTPQFVARAPGRINLIGEHVDYVLFGVIPTAVEMDNLIFFSPVDAVANAEQTSFTLSFTNTDEKWQPLSLAFDKTQNAEGDSWTFREEQNGASKMKRGSWGDYVRASMETLLLYPSFKNRAVASVNAVVSGDVPPGSGLSSSAALIVSTLIALLTANGIRDVTSAELVQLARASEARLGVNTGGMDQAISVLGERGAGTYVTFWPKLGVETVSLPQGLAMVISNSLTTHNLANDAKRHYNLRVVETLLAARILGERLLGDKVPTKRFTLRELGHMMAENAKGLPSDRHLSVELDLLTDGLERAFTPDEKDAGFTLEEAIQASGLNEADFRKLYLHLEVETDEQGGKFRLYQRAKHIIEESARVQTFRELCGVNGTHLSGEEKAKAIGVTMDGSHVSCKDLYECSSTELDELQGLCKQAGALGSRMSGAGWGGCVVSLVRGDQVSGFIESLARHYPKYQSRAQQGSNVQEALRDVVFVSVPGSGSGVLSSPMNQL